MAATSERDKASSSKDTKGPSVRQRKILDAYLDMPNAAAIHRASGESERNVRRIVEQFGDYLEEKVQEREGARMRREAARTSRVEDWLDQSLESDLCRIDDLTRSENEGVALRALKMKQDMAAGLRLAATRQREALLDPLNDLNNELFDDLSAVPGAAS